MNHLLVIVHPGSACGSAEFNLGRYAARADREFLADDIATWTGGGVLVIDGYLSSELRDYPALNVAITGALAQAKAAGFISRRVYGCDGETKDQAYVSKRFIKYHKMKPADWQIDLTGAWMGEESGCVRSVMQVFDAAGFKTNVRDSAICEPEDG